LPNEEKGGSCQTKSQSPKDPNKQHGALIGLQGFLMKSKGSLARNAESCSTPPSDLRDTYQKKNINALKKISSTHQKKNICIKKKYPGATV